MRYFEFVDGKSSKFWEISLSGSDYTVRFGKIGTAGQTQVKSFPSPAAAQKEHDKLVAEKLKKGYQEKGASDVVAAAAAIVAAGAPKAATPAATAPPTAAPTSPAPAATTPPPTGPATTPPSPTSTATPARAGAVKAWTAGSPGEPHFPDDFEILKKAVLQMTDIKTNKNKYYAIELHQAGNVYRVFTHYGRTDDLDTNPKAGQRECRYLPSVYEAEREYNRIYSEKTGSGKGYKEVSLASSRIGSQKAIGTSSGAVDSKTLEKIADAENKPKPPKLQVPPQVADLVSYLYSEATEALTNTVNAKITANGIETPLGILTIGQIEKGEQILQELYQQFQKGASRDVLTRLSGEFYMAIPHRLGRSREAVEAAVITNLGDFEQKQETLQLMKDMLQVNGEQGSVLFDEEIGAQYKALGCEIKEVSAEEFAKLSEYVVKSQIKSKTIKVKRIFAVRRPGEWERFRQDIPNQQLLFHGSRVRNWVGLLSRGILLPKIVVSMGVKRTDPGWLGHGIYFGNNACTAAFYTTSGKRGTRYMAIARVALGKVKDYTQITYGLNGPPPGYDSCHGVRSSFFKSSQFQDDEWVVYELDRQRMEYLVEFTA